MTAVAAVIACLAVAPAQPLRLSEGGLVLGVGRQQSQAEDFLHVQDVAAGGDFVSVPCRFHGREFSGEALSLSVSGRVTQSTADIGSVWRRESFPVSILSCTIKAEPPQDRAVVVRVSLPLNAIGWQWWDDISQSRVIEDGKQYEWVCQWPSGQRISWYPLCVLTGPDGGLCAAVPLHKPRVFRFLYDGALRRLNIFFDIGLSPEARKLPCRADFDVLVFHCHREWGFRDAVERYYAIFPEYALRRAGEGGIWLLGFNPGPMSCPWDFGFRFDEGAQYRAGYDCAHGILPFVYTEPWGKYEHFGDRPTPDRKPRYGEQAPVLSREELRRIVMADIGAQEGLRDKHFGPRAEIARAIVNSAIYDHQGEWVWRHWTDEWSPGDWLSNVTLNPDPDLPEPNRASVTWKYELDPAFLAAKENGGELAGVYLDSVASFMGLQCENFRREHWAHADIPLIASPSARKPAQLHCFACYEFAQQVCDEMHRRGKLVIANTFRPYMQFFCHLIDMVGAGEGRRCGIAPHEYYRYLRFYGYRKPISYMDYGFVDPKMAWETKEEGMQLCLLYAVHPGTGGFEQRSSYEPSRALFRHYEPLICWLDEAGWQPATRATVEPKTVVAERYGPGQGRYRGTVFVALHLPKGEEPGQATCKVELTPQELGLVSFQAADLAAWELVQCVPVRLDRQGNLAVFSLELLPGRTRVVAIGSRDALAGLWLSEAGKWLERTAAESRWLAAGQRRDITNGGFERGLDGWGTGPIGGPKEATLTIEEKAPLSGSRSLRLESQGPDASHAIQQNIVLPPGEYELSFKYRWQPTQEGAAGTVLPRFGVKGPDGHWATDKYVYFKDVSPTGDRVQTYRSRFEIPAGHSTGFFQFLFQGHFGRVLIDDVAVTTIKQAAGAAVLPELARQPADAAKRLSSAAAGDLLEIAAGQRQSYARLRALAQKAGEQAAKLTMPLDNFAICVGRAVQVLSGAYVASASSEIFPSAPMGLKTSLRARLVAQGARLTDVRVTSEDGVLLASAVELTPDGQSELTFDIPLAPPEENYGWADAMADISFTCNGRRMWLPVRLTARLRAPVEVEPRGAFTPALLSLRAVAHCLVPGGCRLLAEGTQDGTRIGFQPVALGHGGPQEIVLTPASSAEVLRLIPGRDLKIDYKTDPPLAAGSFSVPVVPAALCTSLTSALKLDGQADDWPPDVTDQPVGPLTRLGGGEDPSGTQVFAGKYGTDLFILFRTRQPADAPIRASERPHDSSVWEDDCVEVFLQPPGQSEYYHFVLNFAGSKYEARAAGSIDASWNCAWEGAVWHGEGWWTLEMRIPLHELTKREAVAGPWRCNFCRHIAATDIACSWAPVEKSFHEPALFGYLLLSR